MNTLDSFKNLAIQVLAHKEKPTKKQEEWRYSDLKLLELHGSKMKAINEKIAISTDEECYNLFLINGKINKDNSVLPKTEIRVYEAHSQEFIDELFKLDLENGFDSKYQVLQNYSKMVSGILVDIIEDLDKPLKINYLNNTNHVTLLNIREGANIKFYEEFVQYKNGFINQVTKIELNEKAGCKHFKQSARNTDFLYSSKVVCKKYAQYNNYILNASAKSHRYDIECQLQGEKAAGNFYGAVIGKGQENYDMILKVEHQNSYTSSVQYYNQVLADKSQGSFISNIKIPKFLNGVKAHQLNKNLLLGKKAKAFSKPKLNICSDDVTCSHGAAVGNIDENTLCYLKSRGLDEQIAEKLIIQGFLKAVFEDKGLNQKDYKKLVSQIADTV